MPELTDVEEYHYHALVGGLVDELNAVVLRHFPTIGEAQQIEFVGEILYAVAQYENEGLDN